MIAGGVFLIAQLAHFVYLHIAPSRGGESWTSAVVGGCSVQPEGCRRYFAWAPNDYLVEYRIQASDRGRPLDAEEIESRYRVPASGTLEAPAQHLIDVVQAYSDAYAASGHVSISYRVNRGPPHVWSPARE